MSSHIVVAVADPAIHPEILQISAATGCSVLDASTAAQARRLSLRGGVVVVDKLMSTELGGSLGHPNVLFVAPDPGPVDWHCALKAGAVDGFVIPAQAKELLHALGTTTQVHSSEGRAIGVLGSVGGSGTSVLAASLARHFGAGSVLIDADPLSGGLDLLLGVEQTLGARWGDLSLEHGPVPATDLMHALPESVGVSVLTSSRSKGALPVLSAQSVSTAVESLSIANTVVDLSARLDGYLELSAALSALVLVVPAELRAVSAAAALSAAISALAPHTPMYVALRHRGWSGLAASDVERLTGLPVAAEIPTISGLAKTIEMHGLVAVPRGLRRPVGQLATVLGQVA